MKQIIVKIGTNSITKEDGTINVELMEHLVEQFVELRKNNKLFIVSSGAMGCGRTMAKFDEKDEVVERQLYAVVGQVKLMSLYTEMFKKHGITIAQILVSKEDFANHEHFLNTQKCMNALLREGIVPIMNENDLVAVEELMFTDNDELSGLMAGVVEADQLIVLTNVDGVLDENGKVIKEIHYDDEMPEHIIKDNKSSFGKGGMRTKFKMAESVARNGTNVYIANCQEQNVVTRIVAGEKLGTHFIAKKT